MCHVCNTMTYLRKCHVAYAHELEKVLGVFFGKSKQLTLREPIEHRILSRYKLRRIFSDTGKAAVLC